MIKSFYKKSKHNDTEKFLNKISKLSEKALFVGHVDDGEEHYSGMSYPELMFFHHTGTGIGPREVPARPVIDVLSYSLFSGTSTKDRFVRREIKKHLVQLKPTWATLGKYIVSKEKSIFGSRLLAPNAPLTVAIKGRDAPLEDSGALKEKVVWKIVPSKDA